MEATSRLLPVRELSRGEKVEAINKYINDNIYLEYSNYTEYRIHERTVCNIDNLYSLYINNTPTSTDDTNNKMDNFYYGLYYCIHDDYPNVKKYLLKAIAKWHIKSMMLLAHCCKVHKKYEEMKYYYLLAFEFGSVYSIYCLGRHYRKKYKFQLMSKYFNMALTDKYKDDPNLKNIWFEYGLYYSYCCDYKNMTHYYMKAINKGHKGAMLNMSLYCREHKGYHLSAKYKLMMTGEHTDEDKIKELAEYYYWDDVAENTRKRFITMSMMGGRS